MIRMKVYYSDRLGNVFHGLPGMGKAGQASQRAALLDQKRRLQFTWLATF